MSFFKATFMSRLRETDTLSSGTQTYKAEDLDDAMKQHDRVAEMVRQGHPDYECNLVVMGEIESKSEIKRLKAQWAGARSRKKLANAYEELADE